MFLDTPGAAQFGYFINLFAPRRWYDLVPDQTHTLVIAGYGTFTDEGTNLGSDYLTAAITPDGACRTRLDGMKWGPRQNARNNPRPMQAARDGRARRLLPRARAGDDDRIGDRV